MHTPGPLEVLDRKTEISVNRGLVDVFEITTAHGAYQDFTTTGYAFTEGDARLYAAAPDMKSALASALSWMTNVNVNDPATLGRQIMTALEKAGVDKETLDLAAVALVRGPCAVPNLVGDENDRSLSPSSIFTNRERFIMFTALTYMRRTHQQQNGKIVPYSDVPNFPHVRLDPCEIEKLIATFA